MSSSVLPLGKKGKPFVCFVLQPPPPPPQSPLVVWRALSSCLDSLLDRDIIILYVCVIVGVFFFFLFPYTE
jgi:hypothetical protein